LTVLRGFEGKDRREAEALRILNLEDSPLDAELVQAHLTEGGIGCELVRVQTRTDFAAALEEGGFDLILADYALPSFDGLSALEMVREIRPEVPFILISGELGEEVAIETLKKGATDYVLKHRLERLVPTVRRAMHEAEQRSKRERAEEALRRSEQQLRTLVEQIPAVTYTQHIAAPGSSRTNPTLYASPQIEAQTGYPPQAFVEDPQLWAKLLHPEDRQRVLAEAERADESGEPFRMEYRQIARDGRVMWVRDEAVLVRDEEGRPRFWQGVMFDITERKRVEEELRGSEERFRATFEQAAVGMAHNALAGRWLRVNQRLCDILGYPSEELLEKTFQDVTHPDDLKADLAYRRQLLAGEIETFSMEKRYIRKDGSIVWTNLTVSLVREPSGEPSYSIAAIEDITERKQAEEALRHSEELYRTVVEQAAENIFIVDPDTKRILEANAALHRSLGYAPEELIDMTLYDIVAHDRESVNNNIRRISAQKHYFIGERKYRRKDGSLVSVEVNVSIVPYGGKEAMCVVAHDVTEHKRAEQELRRSLSVLLALREAGEVLGSTLESEEVVTRLLEIMRGVAALTAAVISRRDEEGDLRVWRSVGLEALWPKVRFTPEAAQARWAALEHQEQRLLRLRHPNSADLGSLVALYLPLKVKDRVVGVLEAYGSESLAQNDTMEVLISLTNQAASALENAQLYEELGDRERALQDLIGKLLGAQEEERRRVAYEVHDGLAQVASAAHQHLQAFARRYSPDAERGQRDLERIVRLVRGTVSDARRIIANLRPTTLDDLGLAATISLEVERLREEGYHVDYEEDLGDERLPKAVEIALFRVAQEALTNVRKHARARRVRIELRRWQQEEVRLEIRDYGRGFDPTAEPLESGPGERVGLAGMRERVGTLGGGLEIHSHAGAGTSVVATVPVMRAAQ
jgi:PAS domain S-box-containing protein